MLVELLRPAGPDLARRWLAALLMVDEHDRPALVAEVERRVVEAYERARATPATRAALAPRDATPPEVHVVHAPVQRDGHTEQRIATYAAAPAHEPAPAAKPAPRGRAR